MTRITGRSEFFQKYAGKDFGFYNFPVKAFYKLKKYEDLDEKGKLHKFPCALGDTVYVLLKNADGSKIIVGAVCEELYIRAKDNKRIMGVSARNKDNVLWHLGLDTFNKVWFVDKSKAEYYKDCRILRAKFVQ